ADARAAVAANNLASLLVDSGQSFPRALELAQTAKAQLPDDPHVDDTLGWAYFKNNLLPLAITSLERSVSKDPGNPASQLHLGLVYADEGDWQKAKDRLTRALALNPNVDGAAQAREALARIN